MNEFINPPSAPAPAGPYSTAVRTGNGFLFLSGQISPGPGMVSGQTEKILSNIDKIIKECSFSVKDIIKITVFLTDMGKFAEMNEAYSKFFDGHKPARTAVEVKSLPKGALVEIEAVCCR
ncbi:MAG: Rid family detoxifying hydrolase [Brevinematales bacterium]|jgi:2-iminobutanoate/2-iminopropanoate deaminase